MLDQRRLLQLLADGEFHSGQDLAAALGISRSGVWKRCHALQHSLGVEMYAITGKGYKLARPLELLAPESLQASLAESLGSGPVPEIEVHLSLDSTNRRALELARQAPQVPRLILAERQTAGRGRRGRTWASPFGGNLYMSLYWWFDALPEGLGRLSLVTALILAQRLEAVGIPACEVKWPNDVRYQGKKLAGILLELQAEAGGGCGIVLGLGINLSSQGMTDQHIDQPWTDVSRITGKAVARHPFVTQLASELIASLRQCAQGQPSPWLNDWPRRDVLYGKAVTLELPHETIQGIARGIDIEGALLLEIDGDTRRFFSGEVRFRLAVQSG